MIFDWLKQTFDNQARNTSLREVKAFIDGLRSMTDEDMGVVIAVATVIRVNMEKEGFLPKGLFKSPHWRLLRRSASIKLNSIN